MNAIDLLLIEDNEDDRFLALRTLRRLPFVRLTRVAADGVEALDLLCGDGPTTLPDLVLIDLQLPRLSGLEVLARLRAADATRRLPIAMLTSSDNPQDLEQCLALGANAYLTKPLDPDHLEEVTRRLGLC